MLLLLYCALLTPELRIPVVRVAQNKERSAPEGFEVLRLHMHLHLHEVQCSAVQCSATLQNLPPQRFWRGALRAKRQNLPP